MQRDSPASYCVKNNTNCTHTHTKPQRVTEEINTFASDGNIAASKGSCDVECKWGCGGGKDVAAEAHNMQQDRGKKTNKQTHSESRAGWDVRGIESECGPAGPDVQTLTVSLQQHGAVADCRRLETPAALETWNRTGERLLMNVISVAPWHSA